jgi:tetratricopeptide (TPR) repeat protein
MDSLDESLHSFAKAIQLKPGYAEAFNNRGVTLHKIRRFEEALQDYAKAIALKPDYAAAFNNRGITLHELRRFDDALTSYEKASELQPDYAEAFNNRGLTLQELRRLDEALQSYDAAIALSPDHVDAFNNRGNALKDLKRFDEALESYDKAIALNPEYAEAFNNRGITLQELMRLDEARKNYDKAIALRADYADACLSRSLLSLLESKFIEGWADYEWRKRIDGLSKTQSFSAPPLNSVSDLENKVVLVQSEQGLGDTIQFCRYIPMLIEAGAHVLFSPQRQLRSLMSSLNNRIEFVDVAVSEACFDCYAHLMSLPMIFSTEVGNVPASVPYLRADACRVETWRRKIGSSGLKIGICWQGSVNKVDAGRSFPVSLFKEISLIPEVRLISLHKGEGEKQLMALPSGMSVETLGKEFDCGDQAFLDTAAVMMNMDVIITSDTAIAHLAGALGVPVWVALKHVPDWRWMLDRKDSPWYPTMRLFRQRAFDDWKSVFDEIETELRSLIRQR